jgi:hypothetical protein
VTALELGPLPRVTGQYRRLGHPGQNCKGSDHLVARRFHTIREIGQHLTGLLSGVALDCLYGFLPCFL